jgi:hypothetical protein
MILGVQYNLYTGENQPMTEKKELGSIFKEANYTFLQAA